MYSGTHHIGLPTSDTWLPDLKALSRDELRALHDQIHDQLHQSAANAYEDHDAQVDDIRRLAMGERSVLREIVRRRLDVPAPRDRPILTTPSR